MQKFDESKLFIDCLKPKGSNFNLPSKHKIIFWLFVATRIEKEKNEEGYFGKRGGMQLFLLVINLTFITVFPLGLRFRACCRS